MVNGRGTVTHFRVRGDAGSGFSLADGKASHLTFATLAELIRHFRGSAALGGVTLGEAIDAGSEC